MSSYIKPLIRKLLRNKIYTVINIAGLCFGICACIILFLVKDFEYSFDTFHPDKDRLYIVSIGIQEPGSKRVYFQTAPPPASSAIRREVPGVEAAAGFLHFGGPVYIPDGNNNTKKFENHLDGTWIPASIFAEPQYFSIFKYEWLAGNPATALNDPFKVVLTENKARKYFGSEPLANMIGKTIIYGDSIMVQVSGIVKDWQGNTDFRFTDIISYSTVGSSFLKNQIDLNEWQQKDVWTIVKLSKGTRPEHINERLATLVKRYVSTDQAKPARLSNMSLSLKAFTDLHFDSEFEENEIRTADITQINMLTVIALFILILAIFINLSTAQAFQRAKEIGVRKTLGAGRAGLILQYMVETLVLAFLAMLFALLLVNPALAAFSSFIPPGVVFHVFDPATLSFLAFITVVATFLAGFYPAMVLTGYLPVTCLKDGLQNTREKWYLRRGLIVFQFCISLIFIISMIVINTQFQFIRSKNLGFNSDAIIVVPTYDQATTKVNVKALSAKINQMAGVTRVALQSQAPLSGVDMVLNAIYKGNGADMQVAMARQEGDENFIPLYNMQLVAGKNITQSDSLKEFVINETCAKYLGFKVPDEAIGKLLYVQNSAYPIVGVVADFHQHTLHQPIKPMCIINTPATENEIAIKILKNGNDIRNAENIIASTQKAFKEIYPSAEFNYSFFDESIARLYENDQRTKRLINISVFVSMLISLMGMFGFVMFVGQKRAREISVRKVLGATSVDIVALLCREFVILIIIALFIASPIAYYFMYKWLQNFVYRIDLSWWMFILAGLVTLLITLMTVGFHTIRAALTNPTKVLKNQ
jgi:putative ABC transport system permease protein